MKTLECLYLEDDDQDQRNYGFWIKTAWENLGLGVPIHIELTDDPIEAIEKIERSPDLYQLFIADILFNKVNPGTKTIKLQDKTPEGLKAISRVKNINPKIAILAISDGNGGLVEEAKDAGADDYYSKRYASKDSKLKLLSDKLEEILKDHIYELIPIEGIQENLYENNPALATIIDTIQPKNLVVLITKILDSKCVIIPHFIRSGLSGAAMLRIQCKMEVPEGKVPVTKDIILKVSKDKKLIENEVQKRKEIDSFPTNIFIQFNEKVVTYQDWYAISAPYQQKAKTLIDWLVQKKDIKIENVKNTLDILFLGDGLVNVYKNSVMNPKKPNLVLWDYMKGSRQARVLLACEDFAELAKDKDPNGMFDKELIENFLKSKRIVNLDAGDIIPTTTAFCLSHGDLHGRNILVDTRGNPRLIDPANIDELHWACDLARLSVDLIVSGLDYGIKSHDWENFTDWCRITSNFIRGEGLEEPIEGSPNCMILTALKWLREKLPEIQDIKDKEPKPEWEFRLALAIEFMRASYRYQELSSPKRVLGLISACVALKETQLAYDNFFRGGK